MHLFGLAADRRLNILALRRRAQPQVPVHMVGLGRFLQFAAGIVDAHPHMRFAYRPNRAGLHQFDHAPVIVAGMDLRSHLRHQALLGRQFGERAGFQHCMRERLLAVHMLA